MGKEANRGRLLYPLLSDSKVKKEQQSFYEKLEEKRIAEEAEKKHQQTRFQGNALQDHKKMRQSTSLKGKTNEDLSSGSQFPTGHIKKVPLTRPRSSILGRKATPSKIILNATSQPPSATTEKSQLVKSSLKTEFAVQLACVSKSWSGLITAHCFPNIHPNKAFLLWDSASTSKHFPTASILHTPASSIPASNPNSSDSTYSVPFPTFALFSCIGSIMFLTVKPIGTPTTTAIGTRCGRGKWIKVPVFFRGAMYKVSLSGHLLRFVVDKRVSLKDQAQAIDLPHKLVDKMKCLERSCIGISNDHVDLNGVQRRTLSLHLGA
ncbi:hypothetical protein TorRG33x02_127200 [Trema orientale]|uniref:Uncharacterized protein n=1 Tax=Trema orientale TaxID=63057 RepID=A0A2P5F0W1_TREOI|nr:hypothetical protein TorRG33x02_127200 [Trema orientale]